MKRVLLLASLLATQFTFAQQKNHSLELGLHAGPGFSSLLCPKSPFSPLSPRAGIRVNFTTGVSARYHFSRHFAIHWALLYEEKGAHVKADGTLIREQSRTEISFWREVNNNYLTSPLLLAWETTGRLGWSIRGGGFASLLIDSDIYGTERQRVFYGANMATLMVNQFRADGVPRTAGLDYGVALGETVSYAFTDKLKLSLNTLLLASLRKLDKQYDNEKVFIPAPQGFIEVQQDYFGVNSRASNFSLLVNAGLSYRLF
jgi:hypothetical protein